MENITGYILGNSPVLAGHMMRHIRSHDAFGPRLWHQQSFLQKRQAPVTDQNIENAQVDKNVLTSTVTRGFVEHKYPLGKEPDTLGTKVAA